MARHSHFNQLQLVYHPVSNQEAEWLLEDKEAYDWIQRSKLYMIAHRAEITFENITVLQPQGIVKFTCHLGDINSDVSLNVGELTNREDVDFDEIEIELGPKLIRFFDYKEGNKIEEPLEWFTTEKLLYDRWTNKRGISGLDNYKDFSSYELLYVGISKEEGSFKRLVKNAHQARIKILSNESPKTKDSRLTDELYLFFFDVVPLGIRSLDPGDALLPNYDLKKEESIADAEKALVRLLQPKYNNVRFKDYPKGADGLYKAGLDAYSYVISESIQLSTKHARIRGEYRELAGERVLPQNADAIMISGDDVSFLEMNEE